MKYSYDEKCLDLARHFFPSQSIAFLEALAQEFQDCVEGRDDTDHQTLPIPDFLRNQENLRAERASQEAAALCDDCPPVGYPTNKTRCTECPRMETGPAHAVIVPTIPISKEDEQTVDKLMKRLGDSVKRRIADDGKLWAMHVPGPDDVFACESKAAAEQRVKEHNDAIRKLDLARQFGMEPGTVEARVIEWPHSAESHAESLRDGVADTL